MSPISPINSKTWDKSVLTFPNHTIFHSKAWARVLHESYDYIPRYFVLYNQNKISAALPLMEIRSPVTGKRGVSLPFTDECTSLNRNSREVEYLFQKAVQYGEKAAWRYIELRDYNPFFRDIRPFCRYYSHTLDLSLGEDKLYAGLKSSNRRNIKKAQKQGINIKISNSINSLEKFCRLNCITRKKHGLPPQPDKFFKKIHQHLLIQNHGFIALALVDQKVIAGALYLQFGKSALFKYGASHPDYLNLRPNNLVMWEAIQKLAGEGFHTMSLGRTDPENEGLLQFKRGWNPKETQLEYIRYNLTTQSFETRKTNPNSGYSLFRQMPIPVLKLMGNLLYKHVG